MKHLLPILVFLLIPFAAYSQSDDAKIKSIQGRYSSIKAEIKKLESSEEAGIQSPLAVNELVVNKHNKSWPAVGNYSVIYRFYYKQFGEEPYPDTLIFVTKKTVSAAREYFEEVLFGETYGVALIRQKDADGNEHLGYFDGDRLIKYVGQGDKANRAALVAVQKSTDNYVRMLSLSLN